MAVTTQTLQGLAFEHVADLAALAPGEWLRVVKPLGDTGTITFHMTVVEPYGRHGEGEGVLARRHGRALPASQQLPVLNSDTGVQVWRATEQPSSGIPGHVVRRPRRQRRLVRQVSAPQGRLPPLAAR
ncbi:hypothetical protein [Streptomyces niveus]|uniref:hypothetical protein n=1 Tax=Streptomyces niveus TaxID=193462 RepID=UPI0034342D6A